MCLGMGVFIWPSWDLMNFLNLLNLISFGKVSAIIFFSSTSLLIFPFLLLKFSLYAPWFLTSHFSISSPLWTALWIISLNLFQLTNFFSAMSNWLLNLLNMIVNFWLIFISKTFIWFFVKSAWSFQIPCSFCIFCHFIILNLLFYNRCPNNAAVWSHRGYALAAHFVSGSHF